MMDVRLVFISVAALLGQTNCQTVFYQPGPAIFQQPTPQMQVVQNHKAPTATSLNPYGLNMVRPPGILPALIDPLGISVPGSTFNLILENTMQSQLNSLLGGQVQVLEPPSIQVSAPQLLIPMSRQYFERTRRNLFTETNRDRDTPPSETKI